MTRIVCCGTSITRGHGPGDDQHWTGLLAAALPGCEVIARGIDGDPPAMARARMTAEVLPLIRRGTLVLLEFGLDAGALAPDSLPARVGLDESLAHLDELITRCTTAGATCVLLASQRSDGSAAGQVPCIDLADGAARHGHAAATLLHADGAQLNPSGHAVYAGLIRAGLAPLLSGRPPLTLVAAMARNRVIGNRGQLPWHEPADLAHFKRLTTGHAVIMGRKTWESLGRPLPQRRNLVVTRQTGFTAPGAETHATLQSALAAARTSDPDPHIIGGGEIYALALPLATRIELTEIATEPPGDAWFPALGPQWAVALERQTGSCRFRTWVPC